MLDDDDDFYWLWQACDEFGPAELVAAVRAEEAANRQPVVMPEIPEDPVERVRLATSIFQRAFPKTPALHDLRAVVAEMIWAGELEARGIQVAPNPGERPEPVPRHLFSDATKINWLNSRIKRSGWSFEEIEVRWPAVKPFKSTNTPVAMGRSTGRPTKADEISMLIEDIARDGFDLNSISRKQACGLLLDEAQRRGFNTKIGYSEPVLKRALTTKFGPRR